MTLHEQVLREILREPGASKSCLGRRFDLSPYRLKRVFRHIEQELSGRVLVGDDRNGCWIVDVDDEKCLGMEWRGVDRGGYLQCVRAPEFPDGRCYAHSNWQSPSLMALERRLRVAVGPCEPTAYHLSQLPLSMIEEFTRDLSGISPKTLNQRLQRQGFLDMLGSAAAFLRWKERMAATHDDDRWIPPEFADRHRRSSGNSFEFSLKKHFVALEVPPEATREEVLRAWRRLARRYHPDVQNGDEERMKLINLAKERIFRMRRWDRDSGK
jgi:DnaJ-domain-containing protein 1